ncbi:MAG: FAD-binding protein [Planctomycetes bacterium]|nr:FAD-binding protein [Planctomycetota bacterium]
MSPIAKAHNVAPLFFHVGGRISPISIRDQMVRTQMLVERLFERLAPVNREVPLKVLVVGAGAAGVTAAMTAAQLGYSTTLVDKESQAFSLQRRCLTRWIDPTVYDWPAAHWDEGDFPWLNVPAPPLPWTHDWAHQLAVSLAIRLANAQALMPWLDVQLGVLARTPQLFWYPMAMPMPGLPFDWPGLPAWRTEFVDPVTQQSRGHECFNIVIIAAGFGRENCIVPQEYRGFAFWETDEFALPDCGLPREPEIVISGGGDGALQDFLRIVFRGARADTLIRRFRIPFALQHMLREAEDFASRGYHWNTGRGPSDHQILHSLEQSHLNVVNAAIERPAIRKALEKHIPDRFPKIKIIHSCKHFGQAYPPNRFLVLLILAYLARFRNRNDVRMNNSRLASVQGVGPHHCHQNPHDCHGEDHEVHVVQAPSCWGPNGAPLTEPLTAQVVIIRHGPRAALPPWLSLPKPRQVLPYLPV